MLMRHCARRLRFSPSLFSFLSYAYFVLDWQICARKEGSEKRCIHVTSSRKGVLLLFAATSLSMIRDAYRRSLI